MKWGILMFCSIFLLLLSQCDKKQTVTVDELNPDDVLFKNVLEENQKIYQALIEKYNNEDVVLYESLSLILSQLFYQKGECQHLLTQLEDIIQRIEKSDTFNHSINSIGLWNMRLFEKQVYPSDGLYYKLSIEDSRILYERQKVVCNKRAKLTNGSYTTIGELIDDCNARLSNKLLVKESLNETELKELQEYCCRVDTSLYSLNIKDENYGFTPETAINLREYNSPTEVLLNYADVCLESSGIGIYYNEHQRDDSMLYAVEFYHRPSRKKYVIYFLAIPETVSML